MKRKVVVVKWNDAASTSSWTEEHYILVAPGLLYITTVGMLVRKTKKVITVALNYDEQGKLADCISIPANTVTSFKVLRSVEI